MMSAINRIDFKSSLRDYLRVIFYWRWWIIVLFIVITGTAIVGSFLLPPVYEATVSLLVEFGPEPLVEHKAYGVPLVPRTVEVVEEKTPLAKTQSEIVKSKILLGKVVDELSLDKDKDVKGPFKRHKAIERLYKRVRVRVVRDTSVIKISVEDRFSTRSAKIANTLAQGYVEYASKLKRGKARGAYSFLEEQAAKIESELRELEDALQRLKESRGISVLDEQAKLTVEQLGEFDTELNKAKSAEREVSARVAEIRKKLAKQKEMIVTSTDVTTNPVIEALKIKLVDLEIKLTELRSKYTEDNPLVMNAKREVEQVKENLNKEVKRIFGTETTSTNPIYQELTTTLIDLETELNALQARINALKFIRDEYKRRLKNLSEAELEYTRLLRRIKGKEALYLTLLEKQGEAGLMSALENTLLVNVRIIDPAIPPVKPIRPKKLLNSLLGAVVGLITGVGSAFLREQLDHSLKTVTQVVKYLNMRVLGVLPYTKEKRLVPFRVGTHIAEVYRSVRTALLKVCKERGFKTILITSANDGDGKSTIASNLAICISELLDVKVLLVDLNLRKPALHTLVGQSSANLSEVLRRKMADMFSDMGGDRLSVLTVGEMPEDPTKVLSSAEMIYFLKEAKKVFDIVLLDTPAVIHYADSRILAHEADGIIFVVRAGKTRREAVMRSASILEIPSEKIVGVVLNAVEYVIPERLYKRV